MEEKDNKAKVDEILSEYSEKKNDLQKTTEDTPPKEVPTVQTEPKKPVQQETVPESQNVSLLKNNSDEEQSGFIPKQVRSYGDTTQQTNPFIRTQQQRTQQNYRKIEFTQEQTDNLQKGYNYYKEHTDTPVKTSLSKPVKVMTMLLFGLTLVFSVYCMVADVASFNPDTSNYAYNNNSSDDNNDIYNNSDRVQVVITPEKKPEVSEGQVDENGRYTTEGIAEVVRPSVVEIFTYQSGNRITPVGSGSGIIITTDGYIVTNAHVLENASSLKVTLSDEKEYDAKIVGKDSKTDIAVIKIDAQGLHNATLGDSDEVKLGEQVMAIGNPGGLTGSITGGYVSGLNRKIRADSTGYEMNCIQTDAAISPGNSGGALVNMYGQVIGITSSKYVSSSYEGLGFAITINEARPIIEELISDGYIKGRIKIGITFMAVNEYQAQINNYPVGLLISDIDESADIAKTDLQIEDFITKVNGKNVYDYDSLFSAVSDNKPGDTVTAEVVRIDDNGDWNTFEISFKLMEDTAK